MKKRLMFAYLCILFPLANYLIFQSYPVLFTFAISFYDYNLFSQDRPFIGLKNFESMFNDWLFWHSLKNSLVLAFGLVIISTAVSFFISIFINSLPKLLKKIIRIVIFIPPITPQVGWSIIWDSLLDPVWGYTNQIVGWFGLGPYQYLLDPRTAIYWYVLLAIWSSTGYQAVVLLASMDAIPQSYYEAAKIDGASSWRRFWRITVPLLKPTIIFLLVIRSIYAFRFFTPIYVMTGGGPGYSSYVLPLLSYSVAFKYWRFGAASAINVFLFIIIFSLAILQIRYVTRMYESK